jgi:hypothetical protein
MAFGDVFPDICISTICDIYGQTLGKLVAESCIFFEAASLLSKELKRKIEL